MKAAMCMRETIIALLIIYGGMAIALSPDNPISVGVKCGSARLIRVHNVVGRINIPCLGALHMELYMSA